MNVKDMQRRYVAQQSDADQKKKKRDDRIIDRALGIIKERMMEGALGREYSPKFNKSKLAKDFCIIQYAKMASDANVGALLHEVFCALLLDAKLKLIKFSVFSIGGTTAANVYYDTLFREALLCGASRIIAVHNHPSGDIKPSSSDQMITVELQNAAQLLNMSVIDHIIVGSKDGEPAALSMKDDGSMPQNF